MSNSYDPNYTAARQQFAKNTANHVMTVLHDDGLYRHLRFAEPGTGLWSWSIVTWPGHLATSGDIADGYMFSRLPDMFEFFRRDENYINPSYWAEKMPQTIKSKSYSEDVFRNSVAERVADWREEMLPAERVSFMAQLQRDVLDCSDNEHDAREALEQFAWQSESARRTFTFRDNWDWDFSDYDHHLILAMLAIAHGIAAYDAIPSPVPLSQNPKEGKNA